MSVLADRVMAARITTRLTQPQLARRIGVSQQWVQKVESGEIMSPAIEKLRRLAEATNTSLAYLLGENVELELDFSDLRRMERIAKYVAPEWLDTLEGVLRDIARLPVAHQLEVWKQIEFTVKLKHLEVKEAKGGRTVRPLEIHETREPYEEQP